MEISPANLATEGQVLLPGAGIPVVSEVVLEPDLQVERRHLVPRRLRATTAYQAAKFAPQSFGAAS